MTDHTPTPRTDAIVLPWGTRDGYIAMADLARALERELAEANRCLANSALDAKRLRVLMQWGLRHSTDSVVSDPANPYYVALRLEGHGSCTAHGATLAEVADRAIEWLEAPK